MDVTNIIQVSLIETEIHKPTAIGRIPLERYKATRAVTDTHHQAEHQRADALADLGRDVVAELLQGGEEALELAELPGAAGRRQLLVGQRGRGGGARPVAVSVGWRGGAVERCGRVTAAVAHCG